MTSHLCERRPHSWNVVRIEFALFHPRDQSWHLYPRFLKDAPTDFVKDEVTYRMQIRQMLTVTEKLLRQAIHSADIEEPGQGRDEDSVEEERFEQEEDQFEEEQEERRDEFEKSIAEDQGAFWSSNPWMGEVYQHDLALQDSQNEFDREEEERREKFYAERERREKFYAERAARWRFVFQGQHHGQDPQFDKSKQSLDFYFCPCPILAHDLRKLIPDNLWKPIIKSYVHLIENEIRSAEQRKSLLDFLGICYSSQPAFAAAAGQGAHTTGAAETSGAAASVRGCPNPECTHQLTSDEALELLSVLPIQRDWDLFGFWRKEVVERRRSKSSPEPFFARLRFPSKDWWEVTEKDRVFEESFELLKYPVAVQFTPDEDDEEKDFFLLCPVKAESREAEKPKAAYRTYALFMDELQKRLENTFHNSDSCSYLITYPIIANDKVHFLQFRIEAGHYYQPPVKSLAEAWLKVSKHLQTVELLSDLTKAVEQISTSMMQHDLRQKL